MISKADTKFPYKFVVIDDDYQIRKSMITMLRSIKNELNIHSEIIEGVDGKDIIDFCFNPMNNNFKNIIFTDEHMKEMNGSVAIKYVRDHEKKFINISHLFVSISSLNNEKIGKDMIECGANYVFNKPLSKNKLKEFLQNIVK
jgi:CheY-like chemotaxis protein